MSSIVKEILASPIQMANQVSKLPEKAQNFRQECLELKSKTEKLAGLLCQAARNSNDLYERPTHLCVYASADERDDKYLGLPPIAANEPILCLI